MVVDTHHGDDSFERMKGGLELLSVMKEGNNMGERKTASEIAHTAQANVKRAELSIVEENLMLLEIKKMALSEVMDYISRGGMDKALVAMRIYDWARSISNG